MKVLFINNDGGGFCDHVETHEGTTVRQLFDRQMAGRDPEDFLIRVNREPVAGDHVLRDGDRVTMTPTKVEGAAA